MISEFLFQKLLQPMLEQARAKMIEEHAGLRYKLKTQNGNEVDSMFFDRRNDMKVLRSQTSALSNTRDVALGVA